MYRQLVDDELRAVGEQQPIVVETLCSLARVAETQGHKAEAERLYRRAFASGQGTLGDHHPTTLQAGYMLAVAMGKQAKYAEALQLPRRR